MLVRPWLGFWFTFGEWSYGAVWVGHLKCPFLKLLETSIFAQSLAALLSRYIETKNLIRVTDTKTKRKSYYLTPRKKTKNKKLPSFYCSSNLKGFGIWCVVLFNLSYGQVGGSRKCFLQTTEKGYKPSNVSFMKIKVLMELANKYDSLRNLSEKRLFLDL